MNQKLIIFAPFHTNFTPSDGSSIRIAGYTKGLNDLNIDFAFFSPNKPEYVPIENYIHCSINRKWTKLIILHNLLFASFWLRWFSFPIRFILLNIKGMHEAVKSTENRLIWTHQEYTLSLFLYFVKQRPFIYDIHGFFDIQREYRTSLNWWKKIWFELYVIQERIVLGLAPFLNVVSEKMKDYVQSKFIPIGQIFLAPDGIPDDLNVYKGIEKNNSFKRENGLSEDEKVILYAGSFKRIGGVTELVREYVNCTELNTKAVLLLVGGGQEEKNIDELLQTSICKERVFRIKYMPHLELIAYMKMADVI
ncbi:MAG: glycosyltransferase, partial [Paludibacter sp.]